MMFKQKLLLGMLGILFIIMLTGVIVAIAVGVQDGDEEIPEAALQDQQE